MGRADYWKRGEFKFICDVCGFEYHSGQMRMRWDGLRVCPKDWNIRQPQDFVRSIPDPQALPWSRPDVSPTFIVPQSALLDTSGNPIYDTNGDFIYTLV